MSICYVLLKPDVFIRNILSPVLKWFENNSFSILDYKCGLVCDGQYSLMYSSSFQWHLDSWMHNKQAFQFGPSMGLLLFDQQHKIRSSLNFLNEKKGHTLPFERHPSSIRATFESKSRIFNIIHIPTTNSLVEAKSWFGNKKLSFIFNNFQKYSSTFITSSEVIKEVEQHGYHTSANVDSEYTLVYIKRRLCHSIDSEFSFLKSELNDWCKRMKCFYHTWAKEIICAEKTLGIEGTILYEWEKKEEKLLSTVQKHSINLSIPENEKIVLIQTFDILRALYSKKKNMFAREYFFSLLNKWKVFLFDFEKYLIESRFKYDRNNRYS